MNRTEILDTAKELTCGDRNRDYGPPKENHTRIAALWNAYIFGMPKNELNAVDVILMMDLVKTARLQESPDHADSWVDKCGYSAIGLECN